MNKRTFIKLLAGLTLIPLFSFAESKDILPETLDKKISSVFVESNYWIVKPEDLNQLNNSATPTESFFYAIKKRYYNLKNRYKAAKRSFNDPQSGPFDK